MKLLAPLLFATVVFYDMPAHAISLPCLSLFGFTYCPQLNSCNSGFISGLGPMHSMGDVICNVMRGSSMVPTLLAALSYLFGITLGVFGILKLREHVEDPRSVQIWEPIKRFVAGGAFLALPMVISASANLITNSGEVYDSSSVKLNKLGFGGIVSGAPSGNGLDGMLFFFIMDIFNPMMKLIANFGYVAGIILVMVGISRLLKTSQEGAKGPGGIGTLFVFFVAGCLLSLDAILGAVGGSFFNSDFFGLFGGGHVADFALLSQSTGDAAIDNHILAVISAVVGFMIIIGTIAFVRGIFLLHQVADGNQQASLMAAMTHIIGGAFAVNIGSVINAVESTFGLNVVQFI
ncbi:MAG: hypothetical protein AB7E85_02405 [Pseudobdellovibrionaceae bacterium]